MRSLRVPLYGKIFGCLLLNVLLVGIVTYAFSARGQSGLNLLLTQSVRDHLTSIARAVAETVYGVADGNLVAALRRDGTRYGVELSVVQRTPSPPPGDGAPPGQSLPPGVSPNGAPPPPPGGAEGFPTAGGSRLPPPPEYGGSGPPPGGPGATNDLISITHASRGGGYDVSIGVAYARNGGPPIDFTIVAHAASVDALLRFLGIGTRVSYVAVVLLASALLWSPLVWGITRSIRELLQTTRQMARGNLDAQLKIRSHDELGELAFAVNSMAGQLHTYLEGQRQFIADVAHEVISPVSRMQIGIGILEAHVEEERAIAALNDVREDLELMAQMLNELLLFSRSGLDPHRLAPQRVELKPLVARVLHRDGQALAIEQHVDDDLHVMGNAALIERALSNLVRNAGRYAAAQGEPIEVAARAIEQRVLLIVRDRGPGVPESALARLGEPFFRPELSRDRASGGFGLGLAIVGRCAAACGGSVRFRNRAGGGFEAELDLPKAHSGRLIQG